MTTALDLITLALKNSGVNGVGQAPSAEDASDCLTALNGMLSQWAVRRWLVYHLLDLSVVSTNAASYTIGPGCNFATTARIDRLEAAFVRLNPGTSGTVDFPLQIIQAREEWNTLMLKGITSIPGSVFLDSGYPTGTVYFWPIAAAGYELHLTVKAPLQKFANLSDAISLPDEYFEALLYNLAVRIAPMYQLQPRQDIISLAAASLATVRSANVQIPVLSMPDALMMPQGAGSFWPLFGGGGGNAGTILGLTPQQLAALPTTLPTQAGILWNDGGVPSIS